MEIVFFLVQNRRFRPMKRANDWFWWGFIRKKGWCSTVLRSHKARSSVELRHSPWSENFSVTGGFSNLNTFNFWETGKNGDDFSIYKSVHIYHFKILKTKKINASVYFFWRYGSNSIWIPQENMASKLLSNVRFISSRSLFWD